MTDLVERLRLVVSRSIEPKRKSALGQFMTPLPIARFMAALFERWNLAETRLLDAGAGVGSLTAAFLESWMQRATPEAAAVVTAFEIDALMRRHLARTLTTCRGEAASYGLLLRMEIVVDDFIERGTEWLLPLSSGQKFTHAILNPPYKKVKSDSAHRRMMREVGVETVNLYAGFVAVAIALMEDGGELVAIIPRSFCNGPYYRPFRDWMRKHAALTHLHLFDSRKKAFVDDDVLQENIIARWVRNMPQPDIMISWCDDATFDGIKYQQRPFTEIVHPNDAENFIRIPTTATSLCAIESEAGQTSITLKEAGLTVSTGPVVDFRLRNHLRQNVEPGAAALLYPQHFAGGRLIWPGAGRKPNAIVINHETERWLLPHGRYVVTKRFTSKEEPRRIVAHVVEPENLPDRPIGFENHLNIFHVDRGGMEIDLAHGLATYLNSTVVDEYFRIFSGHTQVNATDLRSMRYPSKDSLSAIGRWVQKKSTPSQHEIDAIIIQHVDARPRQNPSACWKPK